VKRADQVLAVRGIDASLAAHGGIEHREEGGGHEHEGDAAMVRRGDEAREVADDATTQADECRVAAEAGWGALLVRLRVAGLLTSRAHARRARPDTLFRQRDRGALPAKNELGSATLFPTEV
jgi:hypothetical protein